MFFFWRGVGGRFEDSQRLIFVHTEKFCTKES